MITPHIDNYGYGLWIRKVPIGADGDSVNVIEHGGGINGFRTGFRRLVDDGHLIVLIDNTSSSVAGLQQGITNILYGLPAEEPKQSIARVLGETIEVEGVEAGIRQYRDLRENYPEVYDFRPRELNRLGYDALGKGEVATAIAVFALNVEVYPDASNTYDSLGEAYMKAGERELAIENYRKSLELNPGNDNAKKMLDELGVEDQGLGGEITVEPEILQTYVGVYELQPGFTMTVTLEDGHMMVQATGQAKFEIFAMSETRFFLKVVDAQIEFIRDDAGVAESLTLFQGGQEVPGTKIQ
jgi:tetratricopeptide (TPR) repeat protein